MPFPHSSREGASNNAPVQLPYIYAKEQQPELVERIVVALRDHARVFMGALTERERQRIIAAGWVAGKRLKRTVRTTVTGGGVLIEFDDADDLFDDFPPEPPRRQSFGPGPRRGFDGEHRRLPTPPSDPSGHESGGALSGETSPGALPKRVPGAGPKPGERAPKWS